MPDPTPSELMRRFYARIEKGRGICLNPDDLDLMMRMGAFEVMSAYTADWAKVQAAERDALRNTSRAKTYKALRGPPSPNRSAEEAAQRALEMLRAKARRPQK